MSVKSLLTDVPRYGTAARGAMADAAAKSKRMMAARRRDDKRTRPRDYQQVTHGAKSSPSRDDGD